ncbi:hypothetical protein FKM82_011281 [Ascaphus truei]
MDSIIIYRICQKGRRCGLNIVGGNNFNRNTCSTRKGIMWTTFLICCTLVDWKNVPLQIPALQVNLYNNEAYGSILAAQRGHCFETLYCRAFPRADCLLICSCSNVKS